MASAIESRLLTSGSILKSKNAAVGILHKMILASQRIRRQGARCLEHFLSDQYDRVFEPSSGHDTSWVVSDRHGLPLGAELQLPKLIVEPGSIWKMRRLLLDGQSITPSPEKLRRARSIAELISDLDETENQVSLLKKLALVPSQVKSIVG